MNQLQYLMKSIIGPIYIAACKDGITHVIWSKQNIPMIVKLESQEHEKKLIMDHILQAKDQIEEYLQGNRKKFDLVIAPTAGTDFQKKVWNELKKIPYGKTISYSELAKRIENDKAVRAVGSANGKNPISLIVPCHRVIAANGSLGGYAGGLATKQILLQIESHIKGNK